MMPIWQDDAPASAKREAALERLMAMCPEPFHIMARPMVSMALERASDAEIDALLIDVDRMPALADAGDMQGIAQLARRYGATDEMISMYLPLFEQAKSGRK